MLRNSRVSTNVCIIYYSQWTGVYSDSVLMTDTKSINYYNKTRFTQRLSNAYNYRIRFCLFEIIIIMNTY